MKKPTFSTLAYWLLSLVGNLFQTNLTYCNSFRNELQKMKSQLFHKNFSLVQGRIPIGILFLFLVVTLSSFSNGYESPIYGVDPKGIDLNENTPIDKDSLKNKVSGSNDKNAVYSVAATPNPLKQYAEGSYAGQVSTCTATGEELSKYFLCGGNDSRLIQTGVKDPLIKVSWERFISGGSCITVANSDCPNSALAQAACWVNIANGNDYLANTAGQFRVKIVESNGTFQYYYFNVYQNTLIPTAITKSDIVKYTTGCQVPGKITVGGFGGTTGGYVYSFSTGTTPGTWSTNNVFTTSTDGTYTAFIKLNNVVGACEFKVINLVIKSLDFSVTTSVISPKCNGTLGSIQVVTSNVGQQYKYEVRNFSDNSLVASSNGVTSNPDWLFQDLNPGKYKVITYVDGTACMTDTKTVTIAAAPSAITAIAAETDQLTPCNDTGKITVSPVSGGTISATYAATNPAAYTYSVSIDGSAFVNNNRNNIITTSKPGIYTIRITDANGCYIDKQVPVASADKPLYNITKFDGSCISPNGSISVNVTDSKGYAFEFMISGGALTGTVFEPGTVSGTTVTKTFAGLPAENYIISVKYTKNGTTCTDTDTPISIGLTTALTASAGVAELSGCGPTGKELQGKVRITNAEGGVPFVAPNPPYLYSFDGKKTWVPNIEEYVDPGKHIFYVKDQNCEVAMKEITLDTKPTPPTITVNNPVFNCDGTATSTVTVTNSGSPSPQFSYQYYLDGVLNPNTDDPKIFKNVTQGDHTITVSYTVLNVPTESILLNETFGSGPDVSSPGMNPGFCWERQVEATKCNSDKAFGNGEYTVTSSLKGSPYPTGWRYPKDHTKPNNIVDPSGRFLVVDAGTAIPNYAVLYRKTIKDIIPNQPIKVTFAATNLLRKDSDKNAAANASLTVELQDAAGVPLLGSYSTGRIPRTELWETYSTEINPGNNTTLDFVLRLELSQIDGIDFAVDDLVVTQMPKACNTVANFPLIIDGSNAFSAGITGHKDVTCNGGTDGNFTISAKNFDPAKGFQYLVNTVPPSSPANTTWVTVKPSPAATSGSVTLTKPSGIYNIKIRYENLASSCTFSYDQEIKMPTAVTVTASPTPATCGTGGTITAEGHGGTLSGYWYELRNTTGTVVRPFQNNDQFTNVPAGVYRVFAKDANGCSATTYFEVTVGSAPALTSATLDAASDLCYDTVNKTKLIVNVTGGTAPFSYSLDGAAAQTGTNANIFTDVAPGTHNIVVTDKNNCTLPINNIIIADELKLTVSLIKDLTCLLSASIDNPVITGGSGAPYTYTVSYNSGTPVAATFPYTAAAAGNYVFTVKDSKGCSATSNTINVTAKTLPTFTFGKTDISCNNKNDGTITISPSNGFTSVYTYAYKLNAAASYTSTNNPITGLAAGIYNVKVIDSKGCESAKQDVTITNPAAVSGEIKATELGCSPTGPVDAVVTVFNPAGGTGPYQYSFNDNTHYTSTPTYSTGIASTVTAYIKDSKGCEFGPLSIDIAAKGSITGIDVFFETGLECPAYKAHVKFQAVGGLSPIRYEVIAVPSGISIPIAASGQYNLDPGDYVFKAIDRNGCGLDLNYHVSNVPDIVAGGSIVTPIKCFGDKGKIQFTINGVKDRGYDYEIRDAANVLVQSDSNVSETITTINVPTALPAGDYTIKVTDRKTNCSDTHVVTLTQPVALSITSATPTKVNCGNDNSQITIVAANGTTNYTYAAVKAGTTAPTVFATSNVVTVDTNSGADLSWDVYVKDANGCSVKKTITILSEAGPTINTPAAQCYTGTPISVTITGSATGTTTYSTDGITFGSSPTFDLSPGSYKLSIKDGFGCIASVPVNYVVASQLTLGAAAATDTSCTPNTTINLTTNGGTGAYTYAVSFNGGAYGASTNPYVTATAGTYKFRVTDSATPTACEAFSTDVIVTTKATTLTLNTGKVDVKCKGDATGSITITPTSGKAPYTYSITKGGSPVSTTDVTNGLVAGVYDIVVTDALGCTTAPTSVTITEPAVALSATANAPANTTCSTSTTVTVTGHDGTGAYTYSFNGGSFTGVNTLVVNDNGLSDQTIGYRVQDANGCITVSDNITVKKLNPPTGINFSTPVAITCIATTTSITLTPTAGTGVAPFTYRIVSGPGAATSNVTGATTGIFTGLFSGSYVFEIKDANGCTKQDSKTIDPAATIAVSGVKTDVKCFGTNDGTATFTVTGASSTGNFTYALSPNSGTITQTGDEVKVTGLAANTYTLTVTDKTTGCISNVASVIVGAATKITFTLNATKISCNNKISTISFPTLSGGAPGYTYAYAIGGTLTPPALASYSTSTTVDTAVLTTNIDVYVKDTNGCYEKQNIVIDTEAGPTINTPAAQCYTGTPISITITGSATGTVIYSSDGITFGSSPTFDLSPGSYKLSIKDGFGCIASVPVNYVVASQLTLGAAAATDTSCTPNTTINLTANGGTGAYTYAVSFNGGAYGASTNPYVTATAGTYKFRVTDSATPTACEAFSTDVIVTTKATTLTLNTGKVDVKCKGDATGSITITPTSGKAPYTYNVTKGGSPVSTTDVTNGLVAGVYDIVVTDALGCTSASTPVTIAEPLIKLSATADAPATISCSPSTTVTVTGHDGTGAYTYSFNGGSFTGVNTLVVNDNGLSDQTIGYRVQDANGCITVSDNITVKKLNPPTGINFSTPVAITCIATTTSITLTPTAGTGVAPFTYRIVSGPGAATSNGTGASTGIFTGLFSGSYVFEIKDANGCPKQASITIDPAATIAVSGVKTDVKCFGTNDGTATFTVTGASSTGNFTYALSPNSGTISQTGDEVKVTGLAANTYTLTVTDKTTGCISNVASVTINAATAISITGVSASNVSCSQSISDILVTATGGVPSYKYAYVIAGAGQPLPAAFSTSNTTINTGATQSDLSWDVYVMDQNDCIAGPFNKVIIKDASPSVKSPAPATFCFVAGSSTLKDVSTFFNLGTGAHTYTVNGTAIVGTNYTITGSGTYTIVATDANGCSATATYLVKPELTILATRVKDLDCNSDGQITFGASNGTSPYTTYEVQFNGAGAWSAATSPFSASVAGDYQFRVTDTAGCPGLSNVITITPKTTPTYSHNETQISCIGGANGVINITSPTGNGPYTYLISKGGVTVSTTSTASGLVAGTYDILVEDGKGCPSAPFSITLSDPIALNATVSATALACGVNNATVGATISVTSPTGGSGGYEYSFNGGAFTSATSYTTTIPTATFTVDMRDSNHCVKSLPSQTIVALNPPTLKPITGTTLLCTPAASMTSTVTVAANAGTGVGTLTYALVSVPSNTTGDVTGIYSGLTASTYVFKVTDANGCTASDSYTVKPLASITASLFSQVDVKCNGGTGSATINVSGFTAGDTYKASLILGTGTVTPAGSTASGTVNVAGLVAGDYTLRVIDDVTLCSSDVNFTILQPSTLTLVEASNKNANCSQPLSKVTVTAGGGKAPYSYFFKSTAGNPLPGDYVASVANSFSMDLDPATPTWYAWVKDANGCETSLTVNIVKDADPIINLPAQQCFTGAPFTITLSGSGGGTLTYSVNGTALVGNTFSVTASGTYKLGVTDGNNCTSIIKDYIVEPQLKLTAFLDKDLTCAALAPTDAKITLTASGGLGVYTTYSVNYNNGGYTSLPGAVNQFSLPGTYQFKVSDGSCDAESEVIIVNPTTTVVANPTTTLTNCNGSSDGSVTFNPTGGKLPYKYSLTGSAGLDFSKTFAGLAAGTYPYIVQDANGCQATGTIDINQPNAIASTFHPEDIKCNNNSPGSIEILTVTNGVGPYVFTLYDKTNTAIETSPSTSATTYLFSSALVFGNYYYTIVDSKGCEFKSPKIPISTVPYLKIGPVSISGTCVAGATVDLSLDPAYTSAPPYVYSVIGDPTRISVPATAATTYQFTGLKFGQTYFFQVEDNNGCKSIKEVAINPLSPIKFTGISTSNVSCNTTPGTPNGVVNFTAYDYDASVTQLQFEVLDQFTNASLVPPVIKTVSVTSPTAATDSFSGLPAGSYTLQALELDGTLCSNSFTFEITQPVQALTASVVSKTNDNCNSDAQVVVKATGGTGPYTYGFKADQGAVATDAGVTYSSKNPLSINFESGTDWDIWVKDANGCTTKIDVTVGKDLPPVVKPGPAVPCFTGIAFTVDLSQYFTSTVGTPVYTLDGVDLASSTATITTSKTYTIGIRDGNGCAISTPYIVKDKLTLIPTAKKELDCVTASPNGSVTVAASGGNGVGTYTYSITAPASAAGNVSGATTGIFTDLAAGNYTFEVTDGTCTTTTTATIDALIPIVPTKTVGTPLCVGDSAGVEIKATGGTGFYEYKKGAGAYGTTFIFTQTAAEGTVTYSVKDSKGCVQTIDVIVTDPTPIAVLGITVNQMSCGTGNLPNAATITVTASGGTGTLQYSFDNGANYTLNNVYTTTIAKTYEIIVKDANGCTTVKQDKIIDVLDPPVITGFTKTQMTCPALVSDVKINHTNGIAPLTFKIVSGPGPVNITGDLSGTYTGLSAGDYMFRITDKNGCIAERLYTVPTVPTLQLVPQVVANVNCNGGATGSATFTASGLFAAGAFTVSPVVTTPVGLPSTVSVSGDVVTLTGLVKGQYEVEITDTTTLCSITKSVTITEPALALGISAVASNVNCNDAISHLTMTPTGGTPNYTYSIVKSGTPVGAYSNVTTIDTATLGAGTPTGNGLGTTWDVDVYIKDANNCTAQTATPVTITKDDKPTVTTTALATNQCTASGNYTFTATGTGVAPLSFSIDGTNFFTSAGTTYTFTVPAPTGASQAYTVTIKDKNGCTATSATATTVYKPLTFNVVQDKDITCVAMPTTTAAQFTFSAGDGNPAYTYEVDINGGGFNTVTSPYTNSTIGTYVFRVTDANTCTITSAVFNVTAPVTPVIVTTPIIQKILCVGGSATMQVNVNPLTGVGPYTYTVTKTLPIAGAPIAQVSNSIFTGLLAGSYDITVTDAKGCISATATQVISDPAVLSATASYPVNTTCSVATVITVVGAGGTPTGTGTGYYYSFNGLPYDASNTFTVNDNGAIQTITYTVKDANGCITAPQSISVNPLNKPSDLNFALIKAPTCPDPTSDVTLTATNGVAPLVFKIVTGPTANTTGDLTGAYTGLAAGDYTFQVTDANGCAYQELYTVKAVTPIAIVGALVNNISCNAANGLNNTGSAKYTVTGFSATGNYTVLTSPVVPAPQISNVGDVITLTGLTAGTYTVTVTDNTTGCTKFDSVTLTEPVAITFTASASKVYCSQDISQITVSGVTGGTGVYTYAVVKAGDPAPVVFGNNPVLSVDTNLTDVSWDVYVKDANGCISAKVNTTVVNNAAPTIMVPPSQCFVGSPITVDLNGFTNVYGGVKSYIVNGSAIATSTATFNTPGTYKLGIKDDNGCEAFVNYTIQKQLLATATLKKDLYCAAPVNATIEVVITDGVAPYSYQMYNGAATVGGLVTGVAGPSFTVSVASAGTYHFVITDSNGAACTVTTNTVDVTMPVVPTFAKAQTNVSCNLGSDGTITITPTAGVAPYTFALTGPVVNHTGDTSGIYTGLIAGSYTMVITDAKGCTSGVTPAIVITEPVVLTATSVVTPFGCSATNTPQDAVITITASNGTAPYSYSIDGGLNFQLSPSFTVSAAKTINYIVRDANGCSINGSDVVLPYTPPTDMNITASPIYCNTVGSVATITVNSVVGGVAPYTYEIISPAAAVTLPSLTNSFGNIAPGIYIIKVTDKNNCSTTKVFEVKEASKIMASGQLVRNVLCNGGSTGAANFTIANYITSGNYTFNLMPATGTFTQSGDVISYTGLTAGTYTFTVTDGISGCTATVANFAIGEPSAALSSTSIATNINCNNDNATITVTAIGGTTSYKYAVAKAGDPVPAASSFVNNDQLLVDTNNGVDMNWIVYVMDVNGCTTNNAQVISRDVNPTISSAVPNYCPSPTGTYTITVTASGFSSALEYSVDGIGFQTSNVLTVNAPGTYNVTVRDANGCVSTVTPVTILQPIALQASTTTLPSCTVNNGSITATATGGSGNYSYQLGAVTITTTPAVFSNLAAGDHTIVVTDLTTNCTDTVTRNISAATSVTGFALSMTPVTCNTGADGTITATMDTPAIGVNDNPVYMYSLNGGTPQSSNVFTGLSAAGYSVTVTSARGCTATSTIDVTQPNPIVVTAAVTEFGCTTGNESNYASISVNAPTGGSNVFTIYEFLKNGDPIPVQRGDNPVYIESDLLGSTFNYVIKVYDSKGCVGTTTAEIKPFIRIDFATPSAITVTKPITCLNNSEDIQVNVVSTGGTPASLKYTIEATATNAIAYPSQTNTSGQFVNLTVGNYIITVTNPLTGCSIKTVYYVNEPNTFDLIASNVNNVRCYGTATGSVDLTFVDNQIDPTNDAGAFRYTITGPSGTSPIITTSGAAITIPNLPEGIYTVKATLVGTPSCDVETTFKIEQPIALLKISEMHDPITCVPGNDGRILANAEGGWSSNYQYELVGPVNVAYSSVSEFTNLTAGDYTVNVKDANGCIETTIVKLRVPTPIVATASVTTSILCNGDTSGVITANIPTGGQGSNYSYILNYISLTPAFSSAPQTSPVFSGLGAGTYSVTVIDGLGCVSQPTADLIISEPARVEASLALASQNTCQTDARLTLSATGGTGPYQYSTDQNFATILGSFPSSHTFSVALGDHQYYVRDVNGCVGFISNNVKINQLTPLTVDLDLSNAVVLCKGSSTAAIDAKAAGGLGNYQFTLLDNLNNIVRPAQSTGYFDLLPAGNYVVHVDSGDCKSDSAVRIIEPDAVLSATQTATPIVCNGNNDGKIVVIASGGTGKISYSISPNLNQSFETGTFDNLKPGFYDILVQDENSCFISFTNIEITEPKVILASVVPGSIKQSVCSDFDEGAFSITIVGGVSPYTTSLDDNKGPYSSTVDFINLPGGPHTVYIKDANGCEQVLTVPLDPSVTLNPTAAISYDCVNDLPANKVVISIDPSNNPADVSYSLDGDGSLPAHPIQASNVFTNLAPGDHFVMAHHTNKCIDATVVFHIDQIDPLAITLNLGKLNEIVATTTGGSGIYNYTVNGEDIGTNNKYIYYKTGDYTFTVTDTNGCVASVTKRFEFVDIIIPPIFTPTGDGTNDTWKPTNTENYPDIQFVVYDRYSREVGRFGAGQSWDGKYNGNELPMGDYWYVLKLKNSKDDREFIGHFTLYR